MLLAAAGQPAAGFVVSPSRSLTVLSYSDAVKRCRGDSAKSFDARHLLAAGVPGSPGLSFWSGFGGVPASPTTPLHACPQAQKVAVASASFVYATDEYVVRGSENGSCLCNPKNSHGFCGAEGALFRSVPCCFNGDRESVFVCNPRTVFGGGRTHDGRRNRLSGGFSHSVELTVATSALVHLVERAGGGESRVLRSSRKS